MDKNTKMALILFFIAIIGGSIFLYYGSSNHDSLKEENKKKKEMDDYYYENREKVNLEMTKNVKARGITLADGDILVEVENLNDYMANIKVYIEFMDENGETITMDDRYVGHVEAGKKSYTIFYMNDELRDLFKTYRVVAIPAYDSHIISYYNDVELISFNEKDGTIQYKINADTKESIDVEWGILYYDEDNNLVDYSTSSQYDVKANKTIKDSAYLSYGKYSKVEVVLQEAYVYE